MAPLLVSTSSHETFLKENDWFWKGAIVESVLNPHVLGNKLLRHAVPCVVL